LGERGLNLILTLMCEALQLTRECDVQNCDSLIVLIVVLVVDMITLNVDVCRIVVDVLYIEWNAFERVTACIVLDARSWQMRSHMMFFRARYGG
jgi:hypothetical protein